MYVCTAGAVGEADMYVGARRDVSPQHADTVLFSSIAVGDEFIYISQGSPSFKKHCNNRIIESHGSCVFYVLVTAGTPSKYRLTSSQEESEVTVLSLGRPFSGFLKADRHKTFVLTDLKPGYDYQLNGTV